MTTTTAQPTVTVTKRGPRRADIDGSPVSVATASRLEEAIMERLVARAREAGQAHLVHVIETDGTEYWLMARLTGAVEAVPAPRAAELDPVEEQPLVFVQPTADGGYILTAEQVTAQDPEPEPDLELEPTPPHATGDTLTPTPHPPHTQGPRPTVDDFLAGAVKPRPQRAQVGWRAWLHLLPGKAELARRADLDAIRRPLLGTRNIVVVNPKGGVTKTTTVVGLAMTIGAVKQGTVLAWDNNETVGNLGSRTVRPAFSVVDLLRDKNRFADGAGTIGDLSNFVRDQPDGFDVLASADTTLQMKAVDGAAFEWVDELTDRWYRLKIIDTGNNQIAENYHAALASADQLVIATEIAEDSAEGAVRMVGDLRAEYGTLVDKAVTVLTGTATGRHAALERRMRIFFTEHTRAVMGVPFDPALVGGRLIQRHQLRKATLRAWERVAAEVVAGL